MISFRLPAGVGAADLPERLDGGGARNGEVSPARRTTAVRPARADLLGAGAQVRSPGLEVRRPSLEDVYLRADRGEAESGGDEVSTETGVSGGEAAAGARERSRASLHQFRFDQKIFWRNPASVFFTVMLPVIFLLIFATIFGNDAIEELGGVKTTTYYVPAIISLAVVSATMQSLAI